MEHINQDFAVISLDNTAQLTVIQSSNNLNHTPLSDTQELKLGMSLTVEIIEASCQEAQGLPLVAWKRSSPKRKHATSDGQKGYCFGEVVQAKVKSVKPTLIQVTLEDGSTGTVHVSEVIEAKDVCQGFLPTFSVKVGSTVTARVIGGRVASSHRWFFLFLFNWNSNFAVLRVLNILVSLKIIHIIYTITIYCILLIERLIWRILFQTVAFFSSKF